MSPNNNQREVNKRMRPNHPFGGIANLSPAYFALVMATGIVSIAAHLYSYTALAKHIVLH